MAKQTTPTYDISILSAAIVFDPSQIPNCPERYHYGRDNITTLATHYTCNLTDTLSEWKEVLSVANIKFKTSREFLDFLVSHHSIYPNLGKISCSLLVIPIHESFSRL